MVPDRGLPAWLQEYLDSELGVARWALKRNTAVYVLTLSMAACDSFPGAKTKFSAKPAKASS